MSESLARFTAEQTARFFAGGELGKPKWTDPEMQRKQDRQQQLLQQALGVSVTQFNRALMELSPNTARRLTQLHSDALAGDGEAMRLLVAVVGELIVQALRQ
jgi:SLT domain-containing protein